MVESVSVCAVQMKLECMLYMRARLPGFLFEKYVSVIMITVCEC